MSEKEAIIALSGGVDSTVAAILLKESGYKLHAVFMQNWDPEVNGEDLDSENRIGCISKEDLEQAQNIAKSLDIPLTVYNFVPEYWENVFEPFLETIKNKQIGNPDILCNSQIKFGVLLEKLKKDFYPEIKLATGHYAKIIKKNDSFFLGTSNCPEKDQTYFLSRLTSSQLSSILFPLSEINDKNQVRQIAKKNNLNNWNRKDSRGICFIGKRNFQSFLNNYVEFKTGNILDIENNEILGKHNGLNLYVLHQNNGLKLSGQKAKYYVCEKNYEKNILYVCKKDLIPKYLYSETSLINDLFWINNQPDFSKTLFIKCRNLGQYIPIQVDSFKDGVLKIKHKKTFITTPGQYIVFYDEEKKICLGSGIYILG